MWRMILGISVFALLAWAITTRGAPAPSIKDAPRAEIKIPELHIWRGPNDADTSLLVSVTDPDGHVSVGRVRQRAGNYYGDARTTVAVRQSYYFIAPGLDIGTVAGYRPAFRGTPGDPFTVGVRWSPVRVLYGTVAPDVAFAKDWIGAGASFYAPERIVGPDWKHIGVGAWYGYPTRGADYGGGGWSFGLSFSIK